MQQFDAVCLTETTCDAIGKKMVGFKSSIMPKKFKRHIYGEIHGICVFEKERRPIFRICIMDTFFRGFQFSGRLVR